MAKEIEIFQIDAFTREVFRGNPAAVTFGDDLNDSVKQLVAKEMSLSETAFISKSEIADYRLQWFTPTKEVKLCGHATIATLHFLFEKGLIKNNQELTFETLSGIITCSVSDHKYLMQIPMVELDEYTGCKEELLEALGIQRTDVLDLPFILLDNGYIFVPVNSLKSLWMIKPDFNLLNELSNSKKEFFDVAVFTTETVEKESAAHLRFFAPYHGINEDPVTGSACGPLILVLMKLNMLKYISLIHSITIEQGDILKRPGRVQVSFNKELNKLSIIGNAVTVFKGNLVL